MIYGESTKDHLGQEFCYIPAGDYLGGVAGNEDIKIDASFYLGRNPVTVSLFQAFLNDSNYAYPTEEFAKINQVSPNPNAPVVNVSWLDAKEFCRWIRKKTGEYYSLPQSDEWERAARGRDARLYPWGNSSPSLQKAFYGSYAGGETSQVGQRPAGASPYGCEDMAGNVWEWCVDCFVDNSDPHILRGGSWQNEPEYLTNGQRLFSFPPEKRATYMGFRLLYLPGIMYQEYISAYE